MGNKAGWLTLYSGIAGGADMIVIPEIPYDIEKLAAACEKRESKGFSILAVAEGAFDKEEAKLKRRKEQDSVQSRVLQLLPLELQSR